MNEIEWLADRFEENRVHLRLVAYRMLGSPTEAEDAVQECWLRLSRSYDDEITNLRGWLTTVVGRVCLDMLRQRRARREDSLEELVPAVATFLDDEGPEENALLADSVGQALLVVLETLDPAERLAFVLHDMFGVPFDEVAVIVERTPAAARKLASRARHRVRAGRPATDPAAAPQREVVQAFLAAARDGDFDALVAVLDPDAVARNNGLPVALGSVAVAKGAASFAPFLQVAWLALVDGALGILAQQDNGGLRAMTFEITDGKIREIDVVTDPEQLRGMDLAVLGPPHRGRRRGR
ncbi:sigma-70 family RNA polymerase sigma factor [Streptomyces sp. WMMC500]|uniref:sigma-70 family RNA polymerase sigma factor n=1 Tax=Streptomyces sp. WMMC500 TaxID=3015154 RepID=UPI00248C4260|nr:sigma-70 family RNA polymerase sigma factor [Streptomyces sp. WMMC500]WBB61012.1 sigma-70 family RNA polymerase sigma factor [Streptomyces sp. WMMC500]